MNQWPLSVEKLRAALHLVQEQLALGHVRPSTSPWNTPIFVIKKKSGKWRLLHDLRAVNAQMQVMGPIQRGLPLLTALPRNWPVIAIDIQDCFFSIPLHPDDTPRFAFTIPSFNHEQPDNRFEWVTLPQGMANSPTLCQLYVAKALQPVRHQFPDVRCIHYMDDILLSAQNPDTLDEAFCSVTTALKNFGLIISPEKTQKGDINSFLGAHIAPTAISPQKLTIRTDNLVTLNDFQKLLGDINWIRPYLKLSNQDLRPLYDILRGDSQLSSPRQLTPLARDALTKIEKAMAQASLGRVCPDQPLIGCILRTMGQPTGVIWQNKPLLWVHPKVSVQKTIEHYPTAVAALATKVVKQALEHFGREPSALIVPYTAHQITVLTATIDEWAILLCSFQGTIDNHLPKDPLLQFAQTHPIIFPKVTKNTPIPNAINIFTDGSKTGIGAFVADSRPPVTIQFATKSPQLVELSIVVEVFLQFPEPFNLISDSQYVVNMIKTLEVAGVISLNSPVFHLAARIQQLIWSRTAPFFIQHIRAHTGLPGPLSTGNDHADNLTRLQELYFLTEVERAARFHSQFHVNAKTLQHKFKISRHNARDIVRACGACAQFRHPPHLGVNPRGLLPLHLWQMDVTHISEFGSLKYVHVSVDTCSGILYASALAGEKASHVITHCLEAWAAWGAPKVLKTDNGPAYTSHTFTNFCASMNIDLKHGLPYNPQGQGIVERAHRTLKELIQKQKRGIGAGLKPKQQISLALFTINFLQLDDNNLAAADRHIKNSPRTQGFVKWKDVLTGQWRGPDPVLTWARGSVCVFPQDVEDPIWVPERLTRTVPSPVEPTGNASSTRQTGKDEDTIPDNRESNKKTELSSLPNSPSPPLQS